MVEASIFSCLLVAARSGVNFRITVLKICPEWFAMLQIIAILYSSVLSSSLEDADDGDDADRSGEDMPTRRHWADKISAETLVIISWGQALETQVSAMAVEGEKIYCGKFHQDAHIVVLLTPQLVVQHSWARWHLHAPSLWLHIGYSTCLSLLF